MHLMSSAIHVQTKPVQFVLTNHVANVLFIQPLRNKTERNYGHALR